VLDVVFPDNTNVLCVNQDVEGNVKQMFGAQCAKYICGIA
jgi:hypothetical protein